MGHVDPIDQLIDTLYETAVSVVDDCAWCDLLPGFCSTFEATAGGLIAHDFVSGGTTLTHGYPVDARCRGGHDAGPRGEALMPHGVASYDEGAVFIGATASCGARSPSQLCGMITREHGRGYLISLVRTVDATPFDDDDQHVLARVLPHLKRSLRLRDEVVHGRSERESLLDLMDQLPVAVLLVSRSGLVRVRNHAADALLAQRDGICLRSGYLAGGTARSTTELRRLISNVAAGPAGSEVASSGEHFVIPRGHERLPLISVAYPGRVADGGVEPTAIVAIKDPLADTAQSLTDFIKVYDITNAEARLLRLLSDGHGLFEAARELAITKNTARTHMRSIYGKVGAHRQSDLVRLLHRFTLF
jgi:DNA-binding CsgD family transcriptional regulator